MPRRNKQTPPNADKNAAVEPTSPTGETTDAAIQAASDCEIDEKALQPLAVQALKIVVKQLCGDIISGKTTANKINGITLTILDRAARGEFSVTPKAKTALDSSSGHRTQFETLLAHTHARDVEATPMFGDAKHGDAVIEASK